MNKTEAKKMKELETEIKEQNTTIMDLKEKHRLSIDEANSIARRLSK